MKYCTFIVEKYSLLNKKCYQKIIHLKAKLIKNNHAFCLLKK